MCRLYFILYYFISLDLWCMIPTMTCQINWRQRSDPLLCFCCSCCIWCPAAWDLCWSSLPPRETWAAWSTSRTHAPSLWFRRSRRRSAAERVYVKQFMRRQRLKADCVFLNANGYLPVLACKHIHIAGTRCDGQRPIPAAVPSVLVCLPRAEFQPLCVSILGMRESKGSSFGQMLLWIHTNASKT